MGLFDGHKHEVQHAEVTIIHETDVIIIAGEYYRKHNPDDLKELELLHKILHELNQIKMDQTQLAQELNGVKDQLSAAKDRILAKISDLESAVANAGNTTAEVDAALTGVKDAAGSIDAVVPAT